MAIDNLSTYETWVLIDGFPNYEVSEFGRIRRALTAVIVQGRTYNGRVLRPSLDKDGYPKVTISNSAGRVNRSVHILVARAFLGPCPDGHEVNHKDGVKVHCAVLNLEYVTQPENMQHAVVHGLRAKGERHGSRTCPERVLRGEKHGRSTVTEQLVREIKRRLSNGVRPFDIAKELSVSPQVVGHIRAGTCWAHVKS